MNEQLPEEKLNRLLPALEPIAEHIGTGNMPDKHALEAILLRIGVEREEWALEELKCWSRILEQAHTASNVTEKAAIIEELKGRRIPEFPAILAVESASGKPLTVEPQSIDFGYLRPGEEANATLKVSGGPVKITVRNSKLKVTLLNPGAGNTLVKVMLSAGSAGESLQDNILLQGHRGELEVPVAARWQKEPPLLQRCPACGEKSLFWDRYHKKYECLNLDCEAEGPSPNKLVRPGSHHHPKSY